MLTFDGVSCKETVIVGTEETLTIYNANKTAVV